MFSLKESKPKSYACDYLLPGLLFAGLGISGGYYLFTHPQTSRPSVPTVIEHVAVLSGTISLIEERCSSDDCKDYLRVLQKEREFVVKGRRVRSDYHSEIKKYSAEFQKYISARKREHSENTLFLAGCIFASGYFFKKRNQFRS